MARRTSILLDLNIGHVLVDSALWAFMGFYGPGAGSRNISQFLYFPIFDTWRKCKIFANLLIGLSVGHFLIFL